MARVTSGQLAQAASDLTALVAVVDNAAIALGTGRQSVRTHLTSAANDWAGPRSSTLLTTVRGYLDRIDSVLECHASVSTTLSTYARMATELAAELATQERRLAIAHSTRQRLDAEGLEIDEVIQQERSARAAIDTVSEAWASVSIAAANDLSSPVTVIRAFGTDDVIAVAPSTMKYAFYVAQFAGISGLRIEQIDPDDDVAKATAEWVELLSTTGIGDMYFTVLETANEGNITDADENLSGSDLTVAASDPELLRDLFVQWGGQNGVTFEPETLDFLVAQTMVGAVLLRDAGTHAYEDIDNDLADRKPDDGADVALAYAAAQAPVVGLNLVQVENNPAVTNSWWTGLDDDDRVSLKDDGPATLGNTNGVPANVRHDVNESQLDEDLERLLEAQRNGTITPEEEEVLENIEATQASMDAYALVEDPNTEGPAVVQLYIYEPAAFDGDGRIAIAIGDLDTAAHIGVSVPGMFSESSGLAPGKSEALFLESSHVAGEPVAILDWQGYDAPSGSTLGAGVEVANRDMAEEGAMLLAEDVAGLNAMRPDRDPHLTVVGNSYGSTTAALAADHHSLQADDLVLTGSPGAGDADGVEDFEGLEDNTYVISASTDLVTYLGDSGGPFDPNDLVTDTLNGAFSPHGLEVEQMGNDPSEDSFGAVRLQGEYADRSRMIVNVPTGPFTSVPVTLPGSIEDHGHYYDVGTESLFNVTAIIGGHPETALPEAQHRDKEPTLETHSPVDASVDGDWLDWTPIVDVDWSNESVVELNAWPVDPEGDREPVTGLTHGP